MAKSVYYEGKLIPAKDWDYVNNRPAVKEPKSSKKDEKTVVVELTPEVIADTIEAE